MKKIAVIVFILSIVAGPVFGAGTTYVLMALQEQPAAGENPAYYTLVKGATEINIPSSRGVVLGTSGQWKMVQFWLATIKPANMSKMQAAQWLSGADGFLAFDFRMLGEFARADIAITNRAFDYNTVLNLVLVYEWWTEEDGVFTKDTGLKADYLARGFPSKLVRVMPMPHYLGAPAGTY